MKQEEPKKEEVLIKPMPCWFCGSYKHLVIGLCEFVGVITRCESCGITSRISVTEEKPELKRIEKSHPDYTG